MLGFEPFQKLQELNVLILAKHAGSDSPLLCKKFIVFDIESFLNGISDKDTMDTPHYKFSTKHKACMVLFYFFPPSISLAK